MLKEAIVVIVDEIDKNLENLDKSEQIIARDEIIKYLQNNYHDID
jgi:hypothetical protein